MLILANNGQFKIGCSCNRSDVFPVQKAEESQNESKKTWSENPDPNVKSSQFQAAVSLSAVWTGITVRICTMVSRSLILRNIYTAPHSLRRRCCACWNLAYVLALDLDFSACYINNGKYEKPYDFLHHVVNWSVEEVLMSFRCRLDVVQITHQKFKKWLEH